MRAVVRNCGLGLLVCTAVALVWLVFLSPFKAFVVHTGSMGETIPSKSLVIVREGDYHVGQVVTFKFGSEAITHRLLAIKPDGTTVTKGDANASADPFSVPARDIVGGVVVAPRELGFWVVYLRSWLGLLELLLFAALLWLIWLPEDEAQASTEPAQPAEQMV